MCDTRFSIERYMNVFDDQRSVVDSVYTFYKTSKNTSFFIVLQYFNKKNTNFMVFI